MSDDIIDMLRESANDYLANQLENASAGVSHETIIGRPVFRNRQRWSDIADLGWLGLALPESMGGLGLGIEAAAGLCEVFGRQLFTEPFIAGALMPSVILGASESAEAEVLAENLATGATFLALAWQEQTGEADKITYGTRLENGVLQGRKRFVSALEDDGQLLVVAKDGQETVVVVVNAQAEGLSLTRSATAQGHYAEVTFAGTPIVGQPLLRGETADAAIAKAVAWARVAVAAQLTGIARGCLNATTEYVGQRTQFNRRLSSFQSVAHRCADMLVGVELADAVWAYAASELEVASNPADCAAVYAAKARAGDVAVTTGRIAVQLHGAMGFTEECSIGLYMRAAMQYNSWLGVPTGLRREFMARSTQFDVSADACSGGV